MSEYHFYKDKQFDLWLRSLSLRNSFTFKGVKFGNSQANVSKDIECTPLDQQVDRQLQNSMPLIIKRGMISSDVFICFGLKAQT